MKYFSNLAKTLIANGTLDLSADTLKVVLFAGQKSGGATTATNAVATMTSTTGLQAGMRVVHANFPVGTKILTVDSSTQVTMTENATATGSSLTFTFAPDPDTDYMSQVSGIEASGTGYVSGLGGAGRKTLASKTFTEDDANDRAKLDAADVAWPGANGFTATGYGVVREGGTDASTVIVMYSDEGGFPLTATGSQIDLAWDAIGWAQFN